MDEKSLFTRFWTQETRTTRNVLARIPDGSDYRPDPRSRTAQEIAWQIVCEEKMLIEGVESGRAEWAPPPMPESMAEVLAEYERLEREVGDAERARREAIRERDRANRRAEGAERVVARAQAKLDEL